MRFETKECKEFENIEKGLWIGHKFRQMSGRFNNIEKITVTVKSITVTETVTPTTGTGAENSNGYRYTSFRDTSTGYLGIVLHASEILFSKTSPST